MKIIKHGFITPAEESKFRYHAWPTVTKLPDGTLFAAWSGNRFKHVCPFGKVMASRSEDGGYTWTPPYKVIDTPLDDRDAGLCPVDGGLLLTTFNNTRQLQRDYYSISWHVPENDAEKNFIEAYLQLIDDETEEKFLGSTIHYSADGGKTFSFVSKSPVTSPHGPIQLKDGRVLFVGANFPIETGIYALWLDKSGKPLGEPQLIAEPDGAPITNYCEPYAAEMQNGDILVTIRGECKTPTRVRTIHLCRSTDGGKTFSAVEPTGWEGLPAHMLVTKNGEVVMTYGRRAEPFGIRACVSRDNGYTWSEEFTLREDGVDLDLGYPSTAENEKGELVTVYYMKDKIGKLENRIQYTIWKLD